MTEPPKRIICEAAALIVPTLGRHKVVPFMQRGHGGDEALASALTPYIREDVARALYDALEGCLWHDQAVDLRAALAAYKEATK